MLCEMSSLPAEISDSHKSRPADFMAAYQVQWPCQKVSECLYITLPSYNMYLITFWHNSALAFILGWSPYERVPAPWDLGEPAKARNLRDYGNLSGACQKVIECLYIILPSYNTYLITFWHNSALAFILGWSPYERVPSPWQSRGDTKSQKSQRLWQLIRCMPEDDWVLIYHPAIL